MKILIAGASGQLGRCLLRSLACHELVALDHADLDVTELERVRAALDFHQPQLVINASAFNNVDGAGSRADEAYAVNALGPSNLAIATAAHGLALLHVSTDYVFDGATERPYHEFDRTNPLSVYGASKLAGEKAVRGLNHRHYIVRTAWLFWENGKSFLLSMYRNLSRSEHRLVCDQYGSPTYVPHLAQGIAQLIGSEASGQRAGARRPYQCHCATRFLPSVSGRREASRIQRVNYGAVSPNRTSAVARGSPRVRAASKVGVSMKHCSAFTHQVKRPATGDDMNGVAPVASRCSFMRASIRRVQEGQ